MSRFATSFILGYHGCDAAIARRAVAGELTLLKSDKDYDWLGPGAYFWESDPYRAREWARWKAARGEIAEPAVIGAVIDLRNCLDLLATDNLEAVKGAHAAFAREQRAQGRALPINAGIGGDRNGDKPLRRLDCAVIRFLHRAVEDAGGTPFDTVRGLFPEGEMLYDGAGFRARNHVQIAVRSDDCLLGVFYPPGFLPGAC